MSLTISDGPLTAREPAPANYAIAGPKHRIFWSAFPRRVRAELGGRTVLDTDRGRLLHESEMLPVLYVPGEDIDEDVLEPSEHSTYCPFKGTAAWNHLRAGDAFIENAAWHYPEPNQEAEWIDGHHAFYWDSLDAWYDEDERVHGHLRDPFHRVDVRRSSRPVTVRVAGEAIARSERPWVLSETGLANRIYVPAADVRRELLVQADKRTHCPYKGDAGYWSYRGDGDEVDEVGWSYEEPFDAGARIAGAISFDVDAVELEVGAVTD